MAELRTFQPSFTAGELSPALWARVDLAKFASGLKTAINLFIHPHGGASNRAGFEFVREVKDSTKFTRLFPFQFNTEQTYALELGHNYMRVFKDGGVILSGASPYEMVTTYPEASLEYVVLNQENDIAYVTHEDHAPAKLSRLAEDNWTVASLTFAPTIGAPTGLNGTAYFQRKPGTGVVGVSFNVTALNASGDESAVSSAASLFVVVGTDDGTRVLLTWNASAGATEYRVYRNDGGGANGILIETPNLSAEIRQDALTGDGTAVPGAADPGAPPSPTGFAVTRKNGTDISYKVSAISDATGEEGLPSSATVLVNDLAYAGNRNSLSWTAVSGASEYRVYKLSNGVYGYIGRAVGTTFVDENVVADLADGPQTARNPFVGATNYPRISAFVDQRLTLASTKAEPQGVWMSQSANYENFGIASPAKASDAVTFRIKSRQANEIRSILALRGMMALTSGAEWVVNGGATGETIRPGSIKIEAQGYRGAARVQPIVVGNTVLFAQARGGVIRDFSYEFTSDSFDGKDLTILSRHLFTGREIVAWAYAQAPYSMVWVVMDDGSLNTLTYMKEHDVWAWTRQQSGLGGEAKFEDVTVIAEGAEDVPYFIIRRTIEGVQRRYIERLHTREFASISDAFFVDSGLSYDGAPATVFYVPHLAGQAVVALADGNVVRNLTAAAGTGLVTLPNAASKVHIGLPMVATMQTLDLDLGMVKGLGTVQGRFKSISELTMRVENTRGIFIGPKDGDRDSEHLVEYRQRSTEAWNEATQVYTGDITITPPWDWSTGGNMWVKQFDPLPMTILALMPEPTIGR